MSRKSNSLKHWVPILSWLPSYNPGWLRFDLMAGITIMALLVPEGMAYAELAGLPPQTAFYAAPAGLILYAIFGSSRQLVVAVSSALAVMSAATVGGLAPEGSMEFVVLSAALALLAGLFSVLAGLLKFGRIAQFFSESVLTGFVFGLALVIAIKQVPKLFGLEAAEGNFFERLWDILINLAETHTLTLVVGLLSLVLMFILEERLPRIPAALVTMIFGILVVSVFGLEARHVHIVGDIPTGLAAPTLPDVALADLLKLVPGGMALALVAFAEAIGPARQFAAKHQYSIDADQELIGLGFANMGAGLFQGFPIGASLSKSAASDNAGARTPVALVIAAIGTALVALFLTPLFRNLPEATLAAIVIVAITGMMRVGELRRLYRLRKTDFALAMVALLAVLIFEVLVGLMIAVIASLLVLVARTSAPKFSVLGRAPGKLAYSDIRRHPENHTLTGAAIIRPNEGLYFANAAGLKDAILDYIRTNEPAIRALMLDLEMTFELDVPSLDVLVELKDELDAEHIRLYLIRVHSDVYDMLKDSGELARFGQENLFPQVTHAVLNFLHSMPDKEVADLTLRMENRLTELIDLFLGAFDEFGQSLDKERFERILAELDLEDQE